MPTTALLSPHTCHIAATNVSPLHTFGIILAGATLVSLLTGTTYFRRVITKNEEPANYWTTVASLLFLSIFINGMLSFCGHV